MVADGTLAKMKTREKKYKPIASYVNSVHHVRDSIAYPWQWSWKDVSTKVQNMRHQYLLVKQKIKKPDAAADNQVGGECNGEDDFDWLEGITHWSNFLRYKEVFGDVVVLYNGNNNSNNSSDMMAVANEDRENGGVFVGGRGMEIGEFGQMGQSGDGDFAGIDGAENGVLGLGFEYDGEEGEGNYNSNDQVREEADDGLLYEEVEPNGSHLKKKRKALKGLEKKAFGFLVNQLGQAEIGQMQTRILHEQQNLTNQLLGIVSQWTGHPAGLSDHTSASNHYLSQMMQNLHHVNGMVHDDGRVDGDNQDDQFIVDG
ncbi:hypothetical protein COLO4_20213 [Corchorus olitorius]|uniref:Uncharacterized protein n=1 Tax=Corchorus olitorius TaxID=93759 RepID=A0A1R3J150_9ROSI|nr:hypothetical protein COLO4_20213 [Corchorus olitorius]